MNKWIGLGLLLAWGIVSPAAFAVKEGVVKPDLRLDFVIIEVNGVAKKVTPDQELVVVAGDELKVTSAVLVDPDKTVGTVNLVGFQSTTAKRMGEDRGEVVHTGRDLLKSWSVHRRGELYRVSSKTGSTHHGDVFIRVIQPKMKFAEILVNGHSRVVREGEVLRLKRSDKISVKEVRTNVEADKQNVDFQVVPNEEVNLPDLAFYEIRFSRAGRVFAKIPMQVEGHEEQGEN